MVKAVLREKKVAFECGTQKRMETETDTEKLTIILDIH